MSTHGIRWKRRVEWRTLIVGGLWWLAGIVIGQAQDLTAESLSPSRPILTATPLENGAAERNFKGVLLMELIDPGATLRSHGVSLTLTSVGDTQGAVYDDDFDGHRKAGYFVRNIAALDVNLEKLVGWRGASFHTTGVLQTGERLSSPLDLGNYQATSSLAGHNTFRLGELWIDQKYHFLGNQRIDLRLGQQAAFDEFALQDMHTSYVGNSFSTPQIKGDLRAPSGPNPQPGLRLRWEPNEHVYLKVGVYNGDNDRFWVVDKSGVAFRFKDDAILASEIGYVFNAAANSLGLAGDYKVGLIHDFGVFNRYGNRHNTAYGDDLIYFMAAQELYRENTEVEALKRRGLDVGAGVYLTPHPDINPTVAQFVTLVRYTGLYHHRPQDISAFAAAYTIASSAYHEAQQRKGLNNGQGGELQLEVNHELIFNKLISLQPNLQVIVHPDGNYSRSPILVLGVRHLLTF
jgi:porin